MKKVLIALGVVGIAVIGIAALCGIDNIKVSNYLNNGCGDDDCDDCNPEEEPCGVLD